MNLQTTGYAAGIFQQDPRIIKLAVGVVQRKYDAEPALILNGLEYFKTDEIVAGIKFIAEHDAKGKIEQAREAIAHAG